MMSIQAFHQNNKTNLYIRTPTVLTETHCKLWVLAIPVPVIHIFTSYICTDSAIQVKYHI